MRRSGCAAKIHENRLELRDRIYLPGAQFNAGIERGLNKYSCSMLKPIRELLQMPILTSELFGIITYK